MPYDPINLGASPNDRQGDEWRGGGEKINAMFDELFNSLGENPTVYVAQESDFPVQDATTITLESQIIYDVTEAVVTGKRFIVENGAKITSRNINGPLLTYTGSGSMFTGVDASFSIDQIQISHANAQGFSFTDNVGGTRLFLADNIRSVAGTKTGTFSNMAVVSFATGSARNNDDGITLSGANMNVVFINGFVHTSASPTSVALDVGATVSKTWEIRSFVPSGPAGSVGISGAAASANVPAGIVGTVTSCNFTGVDTPLVGWSVDDIRWIYVGNSGIKNTNKQALVSLKNNALVTTITSATPEKINGVYECDRESHYSCDTTGRVTYIGEQPDIAKLNLVSSVSSDSGTNKAVRVFFAKDGVPVTRSGMPAEVGASDPRSVSLIWEEPVVFGTYFEPFIANESDVVDLVGNDVIMLVSND